MIVGTAAFELRPPVESIQRLSAPRTYKEVRPGRKYGTCAMLIVKPRGCGDWVVARWLGVECQVGC